MPNQDGLHYGLPDHALVVLDVLERAGHEAWVVGGWVRDALLGLPSHDVDVTTSAPWPEAEAALTEAGIPVHRTGVAHGTITAVVGGEPVEVTTYRVEGAYTDHRHPDEVRFVTDVREDLARRDFTVNAMAYHPTRGLLDPFDGREDLAAGIIRAVGEPGRRFGEDALRVLRAVRFAARMGYAVEPRTQAALEAAAPTLAHVAQERVGQELQGIVGTGHAGWALMAQTAVMCAAIPELAPMAGLDQRSPYHAYDVLEHTARVCRGCEEFSAGLATPALRWAALLHDAGKPATFTVDETGRGHFFGHPEVGARMAETIMRRLALPRPLVERACTLVRLHDRPIHPTRRSIRRTLARLEQACPGEGRALVFQLIDLKRSDAVAKAPRCAPYAVELDQMARVARAEVTGRTPLTVRDLAVTGADVMREAGVAPGPAVGLKLDELLSLVLAGELDNDRAALLAHLGA